MTRFRTLPFFFNFSSKNPEEAELEDTLNQVVRRLIITSAFSGHSRSHLQLLVEGL